MLKMNHAKAGTGRGFVGNDVDLRSRKKHVDIERGERAIHFWMLCMRHRGLQEFSAKLHDPLHDGEQSFYCASREDETTVACWPPCRDLDPYND